MGSGYQELKIVSDTLSKTLDGVETYDELRSEVDKVIAQIEFALANKKKERVPPGHFTRQHAAEYLDMSPNTFDERIRPKVKAKTIGSMLRWSKRKLDEYMEED